MPELVERSDPEGVDYGWVMQVTFVTTISVGAPIVAALSTLVTLPTWGARAAFAIRVGAVIWFLTAVGAYVYARRTHVEGAETASEAGGTDASAAETEGAATAAETEGADADADGGPASSARGTTSGTDDGEPAARSDASPGTD